MRLRLTARSGVVLTLLTFLTLLTISLSSGRLLLVIILLSITITLIHLAEGNNLVHLDFWNLTLILILILILIVLCPHLLLFPIHLLYRVKQRVLSRTIRIFIVLSCS